jgi:hypothetical protein
MKNLLIKLLTNQDFQLITLFIISVILIGLVENPADYISLN